MSTIEDANNYGYVHFNACTAFDLAVIIHVITNLQDCGNIEIDLRDCDLGDKQVTALASALAGEHRELHVRSLMEKLDARMVH